MRLIDACSLQEEYKARHSGKRLLLIDVAPTVDAVPERRGKWIAVTEDGEDYKRICSCCGKEAPFNETERVYLIYPHCPWCGADMRGEQP